MTHKIKIHKPFADAIQSGEKTFEIRKNDRGYNKGDYIEFSVVDETGLYVLHHPIENVRFEITYVLSDWGLEPGYVALAIRPVDKEK